MIGQSEVKELLSRIVTGSRMAHAYLLIGPEGSGRLAMALEIARIINCSASNPAESQFGCPCNSCRLILEWQHPNLFPIFPLPKPDKMDKDNVPLALKVMREIIRDKSQNIYAPLKLTDTGKILIDQIRRLRKELSLSMDRQGVRTIIVQPAERLRDESANAFLNLLEEPPEKCRLLLISESARDLLPTIISRCQTIRFRPLTRDEISRALIDRHGTAEAEAQKAARLANGNFTRALQLTSGETTAKLIAGIDFLRAAVTGNAQNINKIVAEWSQSSSRQIIKEMLSYTALWIKDALMWKAFSQDEKADYLSVSDNDVVIEKLAQRYENDQLSTTWGLLEETRLAIDDNCIIPLALTSLALRIRKNMT